MKDITKQDLNILLSLLAMLPIKQSQNSLYSKKDVLKPIVRASVQNTSIENASEWVKGMSGDAVFYRLKHLSVKDVRLWFGKTVDKLAIKAKKKYRIARKVDVAIDYHKIPYYGEEESPWIIRSKHEKGTGKFIVVITLHIVVKGQRLTIGALPVSKLDNTDDLVGQLLKAAKKHFTIKTVLLDRYFESIEVINLLKEGYQFITPKKRNDRTLGIMESMRLQGEQRRQMTISQGKRSASFDLVILETEDDLVGFITNMDGSPEYIGELYRSRWGIETGYSVKNDFRSVTCSNNFAVRYLLVFLSFLIYNLWVFINIQWHRDGVYMITAKDVCVQISRMLDRKIT